MAQLSLTLQFVNGDPATSGKGINLTTQQEPNAVFDEPSGEFSLSTVATNDTLVINGVTYQYEYLGWADVRGNPYEPAAFIRITGGPSGAQYGVGSTFAVDLSDPEAPGYPSLPNGSTKLTVSDLDTDDGVGFPGVPCFAEGMRLMTEAGPCEVEFLHAGMRLKTRDHGWQPIRWVGGSRVEGRGELAPVAIEAGTLGPHGQLLVSPNHRMLVGGWRAELLFGVEEALVAAKALVDGGAIRFAPCREVTYYHVLLDAHEVIYAEGAETESFYPGEVGAETLGPAARAGIEKIFPGLLEGRRPYGALARPELRRYEAAVMAA